MAARTLVSFTFYVHCLSFHISCEAVSLRLTPQKWRQTIWRHLNTLRIHMQLILELSKLTALLPALKIWFIFRYSLTVSPEHTASLSEGQNETSQRVSWHGSFPPTNCDNIYAVQQDTQSVLISEFYSAPMLARHVSDLTAPSSGAFCTSCIRRIQLVHFVYLVGLHIYYKMIHGPYSIELNCDNLLFTNLGP